MSEPHIPGGASDVKPFEGTFNDSYSGIPPWDIGRPQPEFLKVFESGLIRGSVIDVGCGTGEHAIYLAAQGHAVLGVDFAPAAIEKAREKARLRGSSARFKEHDATQLHTLGETFDSALDSGLFHCFSDENRAAYVRELGTVVRPGGRLILMCFSELETGPGPRRVTQAELRAAFETGWTFDFIRAARFDSHIHPGGAQAWMASIVRK